MGMRIVAITVFIYAILFIAGMVIVHKNVKNVHIVEVENGK